MRIWNRDAVPAWRDIWVSPAGTPLAGFSRLNYKIIWQMNFGETLFEGVAVRREGDSVIRVRVNDIIAAWLRPSLRAMSGDSGFFRDPDTTGGPGVTAGFAIVWSDPAGEVTSEWQYLSVFADWTYDRSATYDAPADYLRYCPIDGVVDVRQRLFLTAYTGSWLVWVDAQGAGHGVVDKPSGEGESVPGTFWTKASEIDAAGHGIELFPELTGGELSEAARGAFPIVVQETCARYCIYYAGVLGGIESFVPRGKAVEEDAITRGDYLRRTDDDALAGGVLQRGRTVLGTTIRKHLTLHTHWLTDEQAARMASLTESPAVWVHDLETDVIYPAVLTGNSHQYKSYRGQGGKLVSYALEFDLANDTIRG